MCACSSNAITEEFVSVYQNVAQVVVQTKLQEAVTGTCDRPTVFVVMIDDQASRLSCVPKLAVMVGITAAAILDALHVIVVVNHFMQQRGGHFFDGARQSAGTDVDFMGRAQFGNPCVFPQREMAVCLGC